MRAVGAGRHLAALAQGRRRRRGSGGGGAAAGGRPAEHDRPRVRWPAWRRWRPWRRLPRTPLRRPRLHTAGRYLGGPVGSWCNAAGAGGLLTAPRPRAPAWPPRSPPRPTDFTWAAAAMGSNNAAGYQLAGGAPVMAIGGFNGTDPSPTLQEFQRYVADRKIHYFIRGRLMIGRMGSPQPAAAAKRLRHRGLGGDPLHPDDGRPRSHLRPDPAAEELIAQT